MLIRFIDIKLCILFALSSFMTGFVFLIAIQRLDAHAYIFRGALALAGGLVIIIIMILALKNPEVFHGRVWSFSMIILNIIGLFFLYADSGSSDVLLTVCGFLFIVFSSTWAMVLTAITAIPVENRKRILSLCLGYVLRSLLFFLTLCFLSEFTWVIIMSVAITPIVIFALSQTDTVDVFRAINQSESSQVLKITNPSSFLPFSSALFVIIVLFACANGFTYTYSLLQPAYSISIDYPISVGIFLLLTILLLIFRNGEPRIDDFFYVATALLIIGCIVGPVWRGGENAFVLLLAIQIQVSGADFAMLFIYILLFNLVSKNSLSSISLITFSAVALCFGTLVDSLFWELAYRLSGTGPFENILVVVFILIFILYILLFLRKLDFEEAIRHVEPIFPLTLPTRDDSLDERCAFLAERVSLTNRETEVFILLAHGRNSKHIQEKLFISHNTVKVHVRNVYAKLDVHSLQELIDKVEQVDFQAG